MNVEAPASQRSLRMHTAEFFGEVARTEVLSTRTGRGLAHTRSVLSALNVMQAAIGEGRIGRGSDTSAFVQSLTTMAPAMRGGIERSFREAVIRVAQAAQQSPRTLRR